MAFHVACPITCRKICFCAMGFPGKLRSEKGKIDFLEEVARVEQFLNDPWLIKARKNSTVQVKVPKVVVVSPAPAVPPPQLSGAGGDEAVKMAAASAQVKRAVLQKQAAKASVVAEDFARRFKSGDLVDTVKGVTEDEQGNSNVKVMCQLCFSDENEGSERARKMFSCSSCAKKYHRHCLKSWSRNRDLFHWSSWSCPSCRSCEVCRRTGDPSKFMFCKRCDGAYHCYCQQPPHKNVGHGPYLCPKHTKCHSCGSSVPGNGSSTRWFLGYTCCDACGRLFVKGNYCPVCLKVYRDSESTPMVCCDICQRWVHCPCDGISDEKYVQFQADGNLQYSCPTCRGECSQVRNIEEAVQELWRRRDEADKDLIASLRAAAGLPTQEEIFYISPFSDDEESGPLMKTEHNCYFKFPLKGLGDKSPKRKKEHGKKSSKKYKKNKGNEMSLIGAADGGPLGYHACNTKEEIQFSGAPDSSTVMGSAAEGIISSANEVVVAKHKSVGDGVTPINVTKASRTIRIKSNKSHGSTNSEETGTNNGVPKAALGPKLVIHLGGRGKNTNTPSISEALGYKQAQGLPSLNGPQDANEPKLHERRPDFTTKFGDRRDNKLDQVKSSKAREKGGHFIKLKNANSEHSGGEYASDGYESVSPEKGKRGIEESTNSRRGSEVLTKEQRLHLKFKIPKNTNRVDQSATSNLSTGNQNSPPLPGKDEVTYKRGQRSKRKRPAAVGDEDTSQLREDNTVKDLSDANWILQKLGKDAAGKRVEIHQPSDDSWHRGTVVEVTEGTSMVSIALDEGKTKSYQLGKQGIRFVSQKQKH